MPEHIEPVIALQVPQRFYEPMVNELARLMQAERGAGDPEAPRTPVEAHPDEGGLPTKRWTREDIARLRRKNPLNKMVKAILDLAAERPGEWISYSDAKERAGVSDGSARAGLAGLTRHVKSRYGRTNWPFIAEWQGNGEFTDAQMYYRVTDEVARLWNEQ